MSDIEADGLLSSETPRMDQSGAADDAVPIYAQYGLSLLLVAAATVLAFAVQSLIAAPNLTLIFVLPVVIAATSFGWGPALAAVVGGVLSFDFFFTEPKFSFTIASPTDIWAAALLFVIAAIVSAVAGHARRQALEARIAAQQAAALQSLAHVVINGRPPREVVQAAAIALGQIFRAPAAVVVIGSGRAQVAAKTGDAIIAAADEEAARGAAATKTPTRAGVYPFDASRFDFWPIPAESGASYLLGVDFGGARNGRPRSPDRFIEVVGACLAAADARNGAP